MNLPDGAAQSYVVTEEISNEMGSFDAEVLLGYAVRDGDRIPFKPPWFPKRREEILFHDLPKERQKWRRLPVLEEWKPENIYREAEEKFSGDERWWEERKNLSHKMLQYMEQEEARRMMGVWFYNDGKPTYITGKHYMGLQWSMMDSGYPDYRDRDRRWWYAWQACIEDPFCYGLVYLKHRRDGATHRAVMDILDEATRKKKAVCAIQSMDMDHALDNIWPKVVDMFNEYPVFFQPATKGMDKPAGGLLEFDYPAVRGKNKRLKSRKGLQSVVRIAGTKRKHSKVDGAKLIRYFHDEGGKTTTEDIIKTWGTVKPALKQGWIIGKALYPTTVEELDGILTLQFAVLWNDSMRSLSSSNPNHQTTSGMWSYFVPCYDGLDEAWIDEYGMSVVGPPTKRQFDWLVKRFPMNRKYYEEGGAWQHQINERVSQKTSRDLSDHKRRFPFTPEEALMPSAKAAYFDQEILVSTLTELSAMGPGGKESWRSMVRMGSFEWVDGIFKGDVKWVDYPEEHPRCRFVVSKLLDDGVYRANQARRGGPRPGINERHGIVSPDRQSVFVIGTDPFEWDRGDLTSKDHELSKAGAHGFWWYDASVDGKLEAGTEEELFRKARSHSFVFEYFSRPPTVDEYCQDLLKAAIYYSARINVEKERGGALKQWFGTKGALGYLMGNQIVSLDGTGQRVMKQQFGTPADHDIGFPIIAEYISRHMTARKFPFVRTLRQLLSVTLDTIGRHDLVASCEMTLMASKPERVENARNNSQIAGGPPPPGRSVRRYPIRT